MMGYYNNMFGWGFWGSFMMVVFWAAIILLIIWLVREIRPKDNQQTGKALEILKERYAKGEIGKEEFEKIKKDLLS